jgi:hypothetical protein
MSVRMILSVSPIIDLGMLPEPLLTGTAIITSHEVRCRPFLCGFGIGSDGPALRDECGESICILTLTTRHRGPDDGQLGCTVTVCACRQCSTSSDRDWPYPSLGRGLCDSVRAVKDSGEQHFAEIAMHAHYYVHI